MLTSGPKSDMFIDPAGDEGARPDAGRLTGLPNDQDFTFAARVTVKFGEVFDAGVLLVYLSDRRWAKLCYEFSPQRRPTAVTVVTHGISDDSNSFATAGGPLWLRVTRSGRAWAFHASEDGALLAAAALLQPGRDVGRPGRLPRPVAAGPGCTAMFDSISFRVGAPANLRDGS